MKGGVNSVPGWKLELVGDLIYLPRYREQTNVAGTQFLGGADPRSIAKFAVQVGKWESRNARHW